jgi:hypothetical protein
MGLIRGRVTRQKRCQALAPSISAASCRSGLTVCRPASRVMAKKPHGQDPVAEPQDTLGDQSKVQQRPVEDAEGRVEHPLPGQGAEHGGNDPGKKHRRSDDSLEPKGVVQEQGRQHPQAELEEGGDEGVDERVLERAEKDRVVQVHPEVLESDEISRPAHHLVADCQPDAEEERVGDEQGQDDEGGREERAGQDVLPLEQLPQPARPAGLWPRHHHGRGEDGGSRTSSLRQDGLDALIGHWPGPTLGGIRLLQFDLGPLDGVLGFHALDGLSVHVHEDVLD